MELKKKGFTLVELIVVITILAILWTIAFISLEWYSKDARDSTRLSDMSKIKTSIDLFYLWSWKYPESTNAYTITYSGSKVWEQWTFWETTYTTVSRLDKIPLDPLTDLEYVYSTTNNRQEYQIAWIYEGSDYWYNPYIWLDWTYAASKEVILRIIWNYNGKIVKTSTWTTDYILAVPSLITSTWATLEDIITNGYLAYEWYKNLPFQYDWNYNALADWWSTFVNPSDLVVFEWNLWDLQKQENTTLRADFIQNLQDAYSGTLIVTNDTISEIANLDTSDSDIVEVIASAIVNNNLGWSIDISSDWSSWGWWVWTPVDPTVDCVNSWDIITSSSTTYGSCDSNDIVVCSWTWTWYVLAACNIWTNISGTWASSYWSYFQWWNNYPFPQTWFTSSTTPVDASGYWPWNYYNNWVFINNNSNWSTVFNSDLWGIDSFLAWWSIDKSFIQWPCINWYHVPIKSEWDWIIAIWWFSNLDSFKNSILLPSAWWLSWSNPIHLSWTMYWMSNLDWSVDNPYYLNWLSTWVSQEESYWYQVRCFKD